MLETISILPMRDLKSYNMTENYMEGVIVQADQG